MERTTKKCAELGLVSNKEETSNIMFSTLGSFLSDPLLFCCLICIFHFHDFIYLYTTTNHASPFYPTICSTSIRASLNTYTLWYSYIHHTHIKWIYVFYKMKEEKWLRIIHFYCNACSISVCDLTLVQQPIINFQKVCTLGHWLCVSPLVFVRMFFVFTRTYIWESLSKDLIFYSLFYGASLILEFWQIIFQL